MAVLRTNSGKWLVVFFCTVLGTFLGVFFQHFSVTAPLFRDIVDLSAGPVSADLLALRFSFGFGLRLNLGTLFGGLVGLWITR